MYQRKTRDEYDVMVAYDFDTGYETVCTENTYAEARKRKIEYIENDRFALNVIIKKRRVKMPEATV